MTNPLILCSTVAAGGVRVVVCLFLISRLLQAKRPKKKGIMAAFFGFAVLSVLLSVTGLSDFYRMVLETVLLAACTSRFQEADSRMSLFVGIFYEIAVSFCSSGS